MDFQTFKHGAAVGGSSWGGPLDLRLTQKMDARQPLGAEWAAGVASVGGSVRGLGTEGFAASGFRNRGCGLEIWNKEFRSTKYPLTRQKFHSIRN